MDQYGSHEAYFTSHKYNHRCSWREWYWVGKKKKIPKELSYNK